MPTVKDYVDALNEFLLRTHAVRQNNVLIIDEAQNLSAGVLEQLRLLTNLETNERKLLQIILIGQPELRAMLARPDMQQLAQRVIARYHLEALTEGETAHYVSHRLTVAGHAPGQSLRSARDAAHLPLLARRAAPHQPAVRSRAARRLREQQGRRRQPASSTRRPRKCWTPPTSARSGARATSARPSWASGWWPARWWPAWSASRSIVATAARRAPRAAADASPAQATPAAAPAAATGAAPSRQPPRRSPRSRRASTCARAMRRSSAPSAEAWQQLARVWNIAPVNGDACAAAEKQKVRCYRTGNATLALIRQLDRPGVLTLRDAANRPAYVMISGLSNDRAILNIDGVDQAVPLVVLADYWRGEFATFWRPPPNYAGPIVDGRAGPAAQWLAQQLATALGDTGPVGPRLDDATLRGWIHRFQLAQGLPSDGSAGPITLMQLNRANGVDEPRLQGAS